MKYFVGVDWGSVEHAVCVVDERGTVRRKLEVEHTEQGLRHLIKELGHFAPAAKLPIAIERPSGLLVDTLVDAGFPVVPIHPNVLKASRPRYRAASCKSDPGDAYMLADLLRTDGHRFRRLQPLSDEVRALRALVRTRDDLVAERVAMANRLRALLESFWPGAVGLFCELDSQISLAFLARFPTPTKAQWLSERRLGEFLKRQSYSGRRHPSELLDHLRAAPTGLAGKLEEEAKGELVSTLVAVLGTLVERIAALTTRIEHDVGTLAVGQMMMSFPRAGQLNAAQIVAELGQNPDRFQTESQLAAEAGIAPVTRESGKSRTVSFRYACNKRLRVAITGWANNSRFESAWAQRIYVAAMSRGCDHPHAVRVLARAWIRVVWRCWQDGKPYDAALHGAAKSLSAAA